MLKIFICEDDTNYLERLTTLVNSYIEENSLDMHTALSALSPNEILEHLQSQNSTGLYFLDLDLSCDMNGFQLAVKIREYDPRAFIVIVTSDVKSHMLTFKYAIEAMDYITKESKDFEERVQTNIKQAFDRYITTMGAQPKRITIKLAEDLKIKSRYISKGILLHLSTIDIIYVESLINKPHYICVFTDEHQYVTRMSLKEIMQKAGPTFMQCHKSCVINTDKIASIDHIKRTLKLKNGATIAIGRRQLKNLLSDVII